MHKNGGSTKGNFTGVGEFLVHFRALAKLVGSAAYIDATLWGGQLAQNYFKDYAVRHFHRLRDAEVLQTPPEALIPGGEGAIRLHARRFINLDIEKFVTLITNLRTAVQTILVTVHTGCSAL